MPALCLSNSFISRGNHTRIHRCLVTRIYISICLHVIVCCGVLVDLDEGLHTDFAVLLFHMLVLKPTQERVHEMFKEAVATEQEFICDSLPCALIGLNKESMAVYIQYVSDRLLKQLGYEPIWGSENPLDFMEVILNTHTCCACSEQLRKTHHRFYMLCAFFFLQI
jgi:hypothetical protein